MARSAGALGPEAGTAWRVKVGAQDETAAIFAPALAAPLGALYVCAHGAGGHMDDPGMRAVAGRLRSCGFDVVRFNFLYREHKVGRPDPMPRLKDCIAAVASHARAAVQAESLILGGRSMGGRAASVLVAEQFPCAGLLLLAYPLHPAGQPEKLRDAHLAQIKVPVLCINGTRDALCQRDLMAGVVSRLPNTWTMHWVEGADHSFRVNKSSGRSPEEVLSEIGEACSAWAAGLRPQTG